MSVRSQIQPRTANGTAAPNHAESRVVSGLVRHRIKPVRLNMARLPSNMPDVRWGSGKTTVWPRRV